MVLLVRADVEEPIATMLTPTTMHDQDDMATAHYGAGWPGGVYRSTEAVLVGEMSGAPLVQVAHPYPRRPVRWIENCQGQALATRLVPVA